MSRHSITRELGIDAGHRVTHHGSKCKNLHGHRYTIHVTVDGPLVAAGEEQGMVLDFSFLKDEMMKHIDDPCDHKLLLWVDDPLVGVLLNLGSTSFEGAESYLAMLRAEITEHGYAQAGGRDGIGLYLIGVVPTAENLAAHWFKRLAPAINKRTNGRGTLARVRVWETPNCFADFPVREVASHG